MERANWDDKVTAVVRGTFLLQNTPPYLAERILSDPRCERICVPKGRVIYTPSAFSRSLGILLDGSIRVSKESLIVSVLRPGELFGAAALFNGEDAYVTTLTALADCDLVFLPQPLVEELLADCPAVARNYITYLSGRIRFLNDKIEGLILGGAERKLAQYLSMRVQDGRVVLDCSTTGLAQRLNVSRASLYRAFEALAGLVEKEGRIIRVLDEKGLQFI